MVELERPRTAWLHLIPGASKRLPTSLDALRRLFREVARAERVRGILLTIPSMQLGWASAQALRGLVSGLQKAGKRVVVYLPQGGGNHEIFLAVAADRVLLGPGATLAPVGLRASSFYLKGLLDRVGVRVEAFTRREFKTAAEGLTR
ncbi:MAG: S49 family peptidase, partial [Myxococcales bacterium]|nr:S49 family peptidase [Myxococcales bacterium]